MLLTSDMSIQADPDDVFWMERALSAARDAESRGEVPVGCVIVNFEGLVACEFNSRELNCDPTAHAEILALRAASQSLGRWRLTDCTLYVTLEPCFMCAGAIVLSRIQRVVYSATDPKAGAAGSLANVVQDCRLNHRCSLTSGVLQSQSALQLKQFFLSRRSK